MVIDYTREIKAGGATYLTHHIVRCPALTADTEDARAINKEMYDICSRAVTTLQNEQEGEYIYLVDYEALQRENYVAIVLDLTTGERYGGVFPYFEVYYFDTESGKKVTYQQYRDALGIEDAQVRQMMDASDNVSTTDYEILWVAADGERTCVMASSPDFYETNFLFAFDESLFE